MTYRINDDYDFIKEFQADDNEKFYDAIIDILIDYQLQRGYKEISQRIGALTELYYKTFDCELLTTIQKEQAKLYFRLHISIQVMDKFWIGGVISSVDIEQINHIYKKMTDIVDQVNLFEKINQGFKSFGL